MANGGNDLLHFNGINIATGGYGIEPMTTDAMARVILGQPEPENKDDLAARVKRDEMDKGGHLGVKEGVDPLDLAQSGWGVIFGAIPASDVEAKAAQAAIREALTELLGRRAAQAGPKFKIYDGPTGYRPKEKKSKWLLRNGAAPSGPADPDKVPYYLLIVGGPEEIPYAFQHQLGVQYAVGRIWFPTLEEYANYAHSVVQAETDGIRRARRLSLFGVRSEGDRATELSSELLVQPLADQMAGNEHGWEVKSFMAEHATHATLESLLGGDQTPALLFTASHGAEFPKDDPRQRPHQGALICSDWPGPEQWKEPIPERFYFAGEHIPASADVAGMMLFCFACFGAGTPQYDEFARRGEPRKEIAPAPFMGALPLSLLGRPNGALAVIGHVDRAWGWSFIDGGPRGKSHTTVFESALERLIKKQPMGHALDYFNARYAELSTELTEELQDEFKEPNPNELAGLWTSSNDARGYVVFGDPAARLCFTGSEVQPVDSLPSVQTSPPAAAEPVDWDAPEAIPRPPEISEDDWSRTPPAVQQYINNRLKS